MKEFFFVINYVFMFICKYIFYMLGFTIISNWIFGNYVPVSWKDYIVLGIVVFVTGRLIFKDLKKLYKDHVEDKSYRW